MPAQDLEAAPAIDGVNQRRLDLLQKTVAKGVTLAELASFLELCSKYELDPFAHEAWCVKSKQGKLLIMVGRDGLRNIGQRNGLHIDGDVVREHDDFQVVRTPDGNRTVQHSYSHPAKRGYIIGAWCECREGGPLGRPMGYFYAPLNEYQPKGASEYSPWSKQVGVMILAAAERQAIRQATPLGGLLAVGEDESINASAHDLTADEEAQQVTDVPLPEQVEAIIARASELEHVGLANRAAAAMAVGGQPMSVVEAWCRKATGELNRLAAERPVEAVCAPEAPETSADTSEARDSSESPASARETPRLTAEDAERLTALRDRAHDLLEDADRLDAEGDDDRAAMAREEAELLMGQVEAAANPDQDTLDI
jgi:hypothetical protein